MHGKRLLGDATQRKTNESAYRQLELNAPPPRDAFFKRNDGIAGEPQQPSRIFQRFLSIRVFYQVERYT